MNCVPIEVSLNYCYTKYNDKYIDNWIYGVAQRNKMRKPSFLLCIKYPRYEWKVIRENRGAHGVSSLILYSLECLNEKPPLLRRREYVTLLLFSVLYGQLSGLSPDNPP